MIAKPLTPALDSAHTEAEPIDAVFLIAARAAPPPAPPTVPIDAVAIEVVPEDTDDLELPPFAPGLPSTVFPLDCRAHPAPAGE